MQKPSWASKEFTTTEKVKHDGTYENYRLITKKQFVTQRNEEEDGLTTEQIDAEFQELLAAQFARGDIHELREGVPLVRVHRHEILFRKQEKSL